MPRRARQITTLFVVAIAAVVCFLGGAAFEVGRYVARKEIECT